MLVAHFGTFDVDNYGDLLFPYVAEWRLKGIDLKHVSPASGKTVFRDALPTITFAEAKEHKVDAVITGGGNIVHLRKSTLEQYRKFSWLAYTYLSVGAADLAAKRKKPLLINGPSIPLTDLNFIERHFLAVAFRNASCLSFRDDLSASLAERLSGRSATVIPDTAFDICRMWPAEGMETDGGRHPYIVVHVNKRYGGDAKATAQALDALVRKQGIPVHFLPIGPCHGDIDYMRAVAGEMEEEHICIDEMSLRVFAREICNAEMYVGSSMHGFITALSYGTPALLLLREKVMHKFDGVLQAAELPKTAILQSWTQVSENSKNAALLSSAARSNILQRLDTHWEAVSRIVRSSSPCEKNSNLSGWKVAIILSIFSREVRKQFSMLKRSIQKIRI